MRPTRSEFDDAWPRIVRALASFTDSLDEAEEYAAEAVARAAAHDGRIDSLAAWCTSVAKRASIDETRRRAVARCLALQLLPPNLIRPTRAGVPWPLTMYPTMPRAPPSATAWTTGSH